LLPTTQSSTSDWPAEAIPRRWIEKLFSEMTLSYGKRFSDMWAGTDPEDFKRHWAAKLGNLRPDELKRGYDAMQGKEWPPTLPEFIKLCQPTIDPAVAYYQALHAGQDRAKGKMGEWPSPAIYWAWQKIGAFDFNNLGYTQLKARWEKVLADEIAKGSWPEIPDPNLALPAPGEAITSREEAAKRIREIGAVGVAKRPDTGSKAWAEKVLAGDYPPISKQFAREALAQ